MSQKSTNIKSFVFNGLCPQMFIDIIDWKLIALDGLSFNLENKIKD
jgi:hypothetical protein